MYTYIGQIEKLEGNKLRKSVHKPNVKIKYFVVVHLKRYFTQKAKIELCMHTYSQNVNHTMGTSNGIQLSDKMD